MWQFVNSSFLHNETSVSWLLVC